MTMFRAEQYTAAVEVARRAADTAHAYSAGDEVFAAIAPLAPGLLTDAALLEEAARAEAAERKVAAVRAEVERWEADEGQHLATFGQHHPASLGRVAEIIRAVLDGEDA